MYLHCYTHIISRGVSELRIRIRMNFAIRIRIRIRNIYRK